MAALLFQGLSGVAGGICHQADPSGGNIQLPLSWLEGSPFDSYLIPGLILLVVLGIFPLVVLYGLWKRQYWGWISALLVGAALVVWIAVEVLIIGYHPQPPLQLIYGSLGVVIIILTLLPGARG
jgi:peptidoglycan/LPS O-acetylase OafA/YrhL